MRVDEAIYLLAGYGANINPNNPLAEAVKMGIEALEGLQSVQPERKKGKWLMADDIPSICSNCGANWIDDYVDSRELYITGKIPNYCPECGSDNRGEQE